MPTSDDSTGGRNVRSGAGAAELDGYAELRGYPGPDLPGVDDVGAWLDAHRPGEVRAGLIHGDYHFANVLIRRDSGALAAIVDWELATIGDPLLDLGHLLATWPVRADAGALIGLDAPGLPTLTEVIDYYGSRTDRDLSHLTWFRVLACYRLGLILEGTHAHTYAGLAPVEVGDTLHAMTLGLLTQAVDLISEGN